VVVIRNTGRAAAQNVHVPHHGLLSANNIHVSIDPPLGHTVQTLPNNTEEIVFVSLPAKFQVAVSYLCFPSITFNQINGPIYSDEGTARAINVLPQTQWPRWVLAVLWALVAVGAVTVMYLLFVTMKHWA
jgi:hypothetical protein